MWSEHFDTVDSQMSGGEDEDSCDKVERSCYHCKTDVNEWRQSSFRCFDIFAQNSCPISALLVAMSPLWSQRSLLETPKKQEQHGVGWDRVGTNGNVPFVGRGQKTRQPQRAEPTPRWRYCALWRHKELFSWGELHQAEEATQNLWKVWKTKYQINSPGLGKIFHYF